MRIPGFDKNRRSTCCTKHFESHLLLLNKTTGGTLVVRIDHVSFYSIDDIIEVGGETFGDLETDKRDVGVMGCLRRNMANEVSLITELEDLVAVTGMVEDGED